MATSAEIKALLAVTCPWCGAKPGEKCSARFGKTTHPLTTLDGESHDARWQSALGRGAKVTPTTDMLAASAARHQPPRVERPW